jgi:hypothetical protein
MPSIFGDANLYLTVAGATALKLAPIHPSSVDS